MSEVASPSEEGDNMSEAVPLSKVQLVDQALKGLSNSVKYRVDADVANFLSAQVKSLTVLSNPLPENYPIEPLLAVLEDAAVEFEDLSAISESLRAEVIGLWAYDLTRANVLLAVANGNGISLDAIRLSNKDVYDYVLANLSVFVSVLAESDTTLAEQTTEEDSVAILNDIVKEDPKDLAMVLDRVASTWSVLEIANVDAKAWGELAKRSRFPASYQNVRLYRDQIGIDESIVSLLTAAQKFEHRAQTDDEELEAAVVALAQELIVAKKLIPDPSIRVRLAHSLSIKTYLELPNPFEQGSLAGLMIDSDLIGDDLETFQSLALSSADWPSLEFAISKSTLFKEFVTPEILQPESARQLLVSQVISDDVKRTIIGRCSEFIAPSSFQAQKTLASVARRLGISLPVAVIQTMVIAKVGPAEVLPFLTPHLNSLDLSQIETILTAIGGDYAQIATKSGKRPKFNRNQHTEALLKRLNELGVVNSIESKGSDIQANMKKP